MSKEGVETGSAAVQIPAPELTGEADSKSKEEVQQQLSAEHNNKVDETAKLVAAVMEKPEVKRAISNANTTTGQSPAAVQSSAADQSGDDAAGQSKVEEKSELEEQLPVADNSAKIAELEAIIADDSKSQDEKDAAQAELDKLKTPAQQPQPKGGRRRTKRKQQKKGKSAKKGGKKHRKSSGNKSRRNSSKKSRRHGRK